MPARLIGPPTGRWSSYPQPRGREAINHKCAISRSSNLHWLRIIFHQGTPSRAKATNPSWTLSPLPVCFLEPPLAPTPTTITTMTSHIPTLQLSATPRTPERRRPVKGASLVVASSVEDQLRALKAYSAELYDQPISNTSVRSPIREPLDEECELCWPLTKETEGPPGPELAEFKQFHYQVWKRFSSAEDLMTDEYLEVCSALPRL